MLLETYSLEKINESNLPIQPTFPFLLPVPPPPNLCSHVCISIPALELVQFMNLLRFICTIFLDSTYRREEIHVHI